jgi:RNA polymerase sigma-70 factor (ECF subfamily)
MGQYAEGLALQTVAPTTAVVRGDDLVTSAYEAYHQELYSFLARATRDDSAAEDLLQKAFLRLTKEARAGRLPEQTRAWLYRVASNLVVSRSRRRSTVFRWLDRYGRMEERSGIDESPESGLLRRERTAELEAALAGLPADARLGLLLAGQGFSGHEIAEAIGRSEAATRTLMCRARMRVRSQLEASERDRDR